MDEITHMCEMARQVRADIIKTIYISKTGHPGGNLSSVELLLALYFHKINVDPNDPFDPDRDRFILSKGHAKLVVAIVQAYKGYFSIEEVRTFRTSHCIIGKVGTPGMEMTSGSLGQNLSVACGMAFAAVKDGRTYKVYTLMGDGELQEGQIWEAAMFAAQYKLGNLIVIVDNNHIQMCNRTGDSVSVEDIGAKFEAFGWTVLRVDGHDFEALQKAFDSIAGNAGSKPTVLVADTVKGKGISFMENTAKWHGGSITDEQYRQIQQELGQGRL